MLNDNLYVDNLIKTGTSADKLMCLCKEYEWKRVIFSLDSVVLNIRDQMRKITI